MMGASAAPADRFADALRRGVVVLGAGMVLVLPHLAARATFDGPVGLPGPVTVLWLGLAAWLMPILLAASWAAAGRIRLEQPWLALPAGLFLAGAIVSTAAAADKSAAAVRAAEMAGLWAALFALAQALRTDAERRLILAAIVASAFLAAVLAILAPLGIVSAATGRPQAPPILLAMAILVAAGLVVEKWGKNDPRGRFRPQNTVCSTKNGILARETTPGVVSGGAARGLAAALAAVGAVLAAALVLTKSRGGLAAVVLGLYLLTVGWRVRRPRRRLLFWAAPFVLGAAALAVAAHVPHPAVERAIHSLRWRLDCWQATAAILWDHGLAGVGLENFGLHYAAHASPAAPEVIQDPHNLFLAAWSMLGLAGLGAAASLAVVAARGWAPAMRNAECGMRNERPSPASGDEAAAGAAGEPILGWFAAVLVPAALVLVWALAMRRPTMPEYLTVPALGAMALALGLGMAEDPRRLAIPSRPLGAPWGAAAGAVAVFFVHEQVGAGFLAPAAAWPFLAVVAVTLPHGPQVYPPGWAAWRSTSAEAGGPGGTGRRPGRAAVVSSSLTLAAMALGFAYVRFLMIPVGREGGFLHLAAAAADPEDKDGLLGDAAAANPWAWEPPMARGRLWQALTREAAQAGSGPDAATSAERAVAAYRDALDRVPLLWAAHLRMAECRLTVPGALDDLAALDAARRHLEEAARLYPAQPEVRRVLAEVTARQKGGAERTNSP
jgi:O-antigen ligase